MHVGRVAARAAAVDGVGVADGGSTGGAADSVGGLGRVSSTDVASECYQDVRMTVLFLGGCVVVRM